MEKMKPAPKRVFVNRIDSYASKNIAKLFSESALEATEDNSEDLDGESQTDQSETGFELVGTVSDQPDQEWPFVLEQYFQPDRDDLLSKLLACDVIIYNISQHGDQVDEGFWAVSALHDEMGHFSKPKVFILISTVMTWACNKSPDPDDPELLTDESFRRRKAHPNFRKHVDLEKKVVKLGKTDKTRFSTYVVASGLQYGMGEQIFHYFFKTSWIGEEHEIPVFGDGENFVPTVHVGDLARLVQKVVVHQPEPQYLLAVDGSSCTMGDIVKAVATELGPGKICKKPVEEAFLAKDLSVMEIDSMLVNLRMSAVHMETLLSDNWLCKAGLVENMEAVVEEFRQERGLQPLRICVLGPPAVGKSTACRAICEHYQLHRASFRDSEIVPQEGEDAAHDPENSPKHMDQNGSRDRVTSTLDDRLKTLNEKLLSAPCRNQGFVLDGFPETCEQAKEFFDGGDDDTPKIVPDLVLCLDASDDFLIDRVINLPESAVQKHNYEQERFLRRLAEYRSNVDADPVVNYFLEMDATPLRLEVTSSSEHDWRLLMLKVYDTVGRPKNYGSASREEEEEGQRKAEERLRREAQEKEEEEQWQEEESRRREACWKEWNQKREETRQREEELLEAQSLSMRNYLLERVMPTLSHGLAECCRAKPEDPVDFLAEYLVKNNPSDF